MASRKNIIDLSWLKKVLFLLLILSCASAFLVFMVPASFDEQSALNAQPLSRSELNNIVFTSQDCAQLLKDLTQRQLFVPLQTKSASDPQVDPEQVVKALKLVGIINTQPAKAVINDTKDNKTYYLEQGARISGDISIEQIKKDSVIIDCYGEAFELYL